MQNENVLFLDTSGNPLSVALSNSGVLIKAKRKGVKQEELLFPAVNSLLKKRGLALKDINRIYAVNGPGRFTGIRLALTMASVLEQLNGVKVFSVTAFEAIAWQTAKAAAFKKSGKKLIAAVIHAFKEEYFVQFYSCAGGQIKEAQPPKWLNMQELASYLGQYKNEVYVSGLNSVGGSIKEVIGADFDCAPKSMGVLNIDTLFNMAHEGYGGFKSVLTPLYLKPAKFELSAK